MPGSTYSTNLKVELMATGENSGTWGDITNTNLGTALEQAIVGYGNPDYASDANLTISITNSNAAQAARALVLNVTSSVSLTATRELVVPTIQKQYIVQNNTTGSQSITVKTSAGTGITVPNGRKAHLYVDGTNVIQMFDFVDINGGAIDGTPIGASSASTGAFTTLNASGATTLDGNVTLGNASGDNVTVTGTITSNLLFTDNTYDIGASGATRPRNLFLAGAATIGGNLSVGGTLTLTGGVNLNGNVTVGDSSSDTLTINSTITSNLIFTDNTYDIGASGATRPRNLFLAGNATIGGNQTLTGSLTVDSTTDSSSTTTGSIQTDGGLGVAKALYVGTTANIAGAVTLSGGTANGVAYLNGSKVLTTGSALTFDGTNFGVGTSSYGNAGSINAAVGVPGTTTGGLQLWSTTTTSHYVQFGDGTTGDGPYRGAVGYNHSLDALVLYAAGAEKASLTSTGLGVGTSPSYALDVKPSSAFNVARFTGQASSVSTYIYTDTAYWAFGDGTSYTGQLYGGHTINKTLSMYTDSVERVTVGATGNVGINTPSANAKLEVSIAASTSGEIARFTSPSYDSVYIAAGSSVSSCGIGTLSSSAFNLFVNGSSKAVLTNGGYFGVGVSNPAANFDLRGSGVVSQYIISTSASSQENQIVSLCNSGGGYSLLNIDASILKFRINGAESFRINGTSGDLLVGRNVSVATSSAASKIEFYNTNGTYDIASIRTFVGAGQVNRGEFGFYTNTGATQTLAMYINRTQYVGIGTSTTPAYYLDVNVNAPQTYAARIINTSGSYSTDSALLVSTSTASSARIISAQNAGTERFSVTGAGITTVGAASGDIAGSTPLQVQTGITVANGLYTMGSWTTNSAGDVIISSNSYPANTGIDSNIVFKLGSSGGGGPNEVGRFVSSGYFQVTGSDRIIRVNSSTSGGNALIRYSDNGTAKFSSGWNPATGYIVYDDAALSYRMIITTSGNFLLGATDLASNFRAGISGNANALILAGTGGDTLMVRSSQATSPSQSIASFFSDNVGGINYSSGTLRFNFTTNGGLANYQANDTNLSDRREKTNFAPAKSYLDTICAIPVQTFNYIDQSEDDPGLTLGVVAQDVQAVAPELVAETNWGTKDNPKMRLSIYQTDLQYALMKALQELKAEFDAYKASHP